MSGAFMWKGIYLDDPDHLKELGDELFALNADAVSQRYEEPAEKIEYRFEWAACNKYQALKSLSCLLYQCSEGDVPNRALYKALEDCKSALMYEIIARLPEYESAKWDADDPTHTVEIIRLTATNRPGDEAAIYAVETGCDYSTALARCNMD